MTDLSPQPPTSLQAVTKRGARLAVAKRLGLTMHFLLKRIEREDWSQRYCGTIHWVGGETTHVDLTHPRHDAQRLAASAN